MKMSAIRWLRLSLAFTIFAATLGLLPSPAYACDCAEGPPIEEVADQIHTAFLGRQLSSEVLDEPARSDSRGTWDVALTFEVLEVYRGEVTNPIVVYTEQDDCGVDYDAYGLVGVFAYDVGDISTVRSCRPFRADKATLVQLYGAPTEPRSVDEMEQPTDTAATESAQGDVVELGDDTVDADEDSSSWVLVLAPAVAIGCAGLALFLRARRSD